MVDSARTVAKVAGLPASRTSKERFWLCTRTCPEQGSQLQPAYCRGYLQVAILPMDLEQGKLPADSIEVQSAAEKSLRFMVASKSPSGKITSPGDFGDFGPSSEVLESKTSNNRNPRNPDNISSC